MAEMTAWVNTSDGWKQAFYSENNRRNAQVYHPRKWWQLSRRKVSEFIRREAVDFLMIEDPSRE